MNQAIGRNQIEKYSMGDAKELRKSMEIKIEKQRLGKKMENQTLLLFS